MIHILRNYGYRYIIFPDYNAIIFFNKKQQAILDENEIEMDVPVIHP